MKIPYGISNFESLRAEGYIYIDKTSYKTSYIETLEKIDSKYIFFIRPRRFGKSLFLSTLEHYYDINSRDKFQKLFGNLYIGKNPTPLKNSYMVLRLNFSGLNTENREKLEESFRLRVARAVENFNIKTDYGRLNRLTANEENKAILDEIIKNESITANIATRFSFDTMYDREYFVSLLFYMGLLTIGGVQYGQTKLEIPNYVTKEIFWEYIEKRLKLDFGIKLNSEELAKAVWEIGAEGRIKPFIDYISENVLKVLSNRDLIKDEKYIKLIMFAYLTTSRLYRLMSERETEEGYIDIYIEKAPHTSDIKYEWLIELKYLKESEREKLEQVRKQGLEQLEKYAKSKNLADRDNLKKALLIFIGKKDYVIVEGRCWKWIKLDIKDQMLTILKRIERLWGKKNGGFLGYMLKTVKKIDSDINLLVEFEGSKKSFDNFMELCFFWKKSCLIF